MKMQAATISPLSMGAVHTCAYLISTFIRRTSSRRIIQAISVHELVGGGHGLGYLAFLRPLQGLRMSRVYPSSIL